MGTDFLVIGNGFDLQCGLRSEYIDFFEYHVNNNRDIFTKIEYFLSAEIVNKSQFRNVTQYRELVTLTCKNYLVNDKIRLNNEVNFWDIVFLIYKIDSQSNTFIKKMNDFLWVDVEEVIKNFLFSKEESGASILDKLFKRISILHRKEILRADEDLYLKLSILTFYVFLELDFSNQDANFIKSSALLSSSVEKKEIEYFRRFLLNELNRFERNFKDYLRYAISNNSIYDIKAEELLNTISSIERTPFVLSFNFTVPSIKTMNGNGINVHGSIIDDRLNYEVIFGIDSLDNDVNTDYYLFTKTSRRLRMFSELNNRSIPHRSKIDRIIFYGHSLGSADYSYFYSIFDFYKLYESSVRLIFKFTVFDESRRAEIEYEAFKRVNNLILKYGTSSSIGEKGKNLLHKLILENRISIDEIISLS